ncbi:serine/threonine-protein kinase [Enhygromyxa salina]|uniref:serine/threonine-protein kinase n=1 Tax=Enhygromyxa salina TaxID=215803 RepID=UPI0011BAA916|nr:serine/threonine-protein kinase [Enhygromyxa salina]
MANESEHPTLIGGEQGEALGQRSSGDDTLIAPDAESVPRTGGARRAKILARGHSIGRYVVIDRLGAGGMGVVYTAYDPELDRKVAVKLLQTGHGGSSRGTTGATRLQREAQAMGALSHPNVITVHDVGTFDDEVFVAMEFVDGWTLGGWLEAKTRSLAAILEVFQAAGQGLAAAHAAGLIHRDFKPDNVMVGRDGRVRVMDFGLARRMDASPDREAKVAAQLEPSPPNLDLTTTGAVLGTPAYMSPEQHLSKPTDARSDQFSYCVALYEAVYGERPFRGENFAALAFAVYRGQIADAPSGSKVPGWLRSVLLRGLATMPEARFTNMDELLAQLGRDRRNVARRWALVGAGALILAAVTWGTLASRTQASVCTGGQAQLEQVWNDARRSELERAFASTDKPYAAHTWATVSPIIHAYGQAWIEAHQDACEATRVRAEQSDELLDLRMMCLRERLQGLRGIVDAYASVGPDALEGLDAAVELASDLAPISECSDIERLSAPIKPPSDPQAREAVALLREQLAGVRTLAARGAYAQGVEQASAALSRARELDYAPATAEALVWLGRLQHLAGDHASAEQSLLEGADQAAIGRHDRVAARAWIELVEVVGAKQARPREGTLLAKVAAAANHRGDDDGQTADLAVALAAVYKVEARFDAAQTELEQALQLRQAKLGSDHVEVADTLLALGEILREQGHYEQATARFEAARTILETTLGSQHPEVARVYNSMGNAAIRAGRLDEAIGYHEAALAIREASLGPEHPDVAASLNNLGAAHEGLGQLTESLANHQRALAIRSVALGETHPNVAMSLNNIGNVYRTMGQLDDALSHYERALAIKIEALGPEHPSVGETLGNISNVHVSRKQWEPALEFALRTQTIFEASLGPEHPNVGSGLVNLSSIHAHLLEWDAALATAERGLAIFLAILDPNHPLVASARMNLGIAQLHLGNAAQAASELEQARAVTVGSGSKQGLAQTDRSLGVAY